MPRIKLNVADEHKPHPTATVASPIQMSFSTAFTCRYIQQQLISTITTITLPSPCYGSSSAPRSVSKLPVPGIFQKSSRNVVLRHRRDPHGCRGTEDFHHVLFLAAISRLRVLTLLLILQKIPCEFNFEIPDLGHLDNNPTHPLKAGTKLALPLWLAEMLALANTSGPSTADEDAKSFVNLSLPPALSSEVSQALKADPRAVPLRNQSPHFYGLATRLMDLFEERELDSVLRKTFVTRAGDIALHARKGTGGAGAGKEDASNLGMSDGGEFLKGLDEWERKLFRKAHDGTKAGKVWMENVKKH